MTDQTDYDGAIEYASHQLRTGLPDGLTYHTFEHTIGDVIPAVERLARLNNVSQEELQLLKVGAAFHDIGYINIRQGHEIASARIAAQVLPAYQFEPGQIETVMGMILATRIPQSPQNYLEEILADADLDNLGREDFFEQSEALRYELITFERPLTERQWKQEQVKFLKAHTYHTEAARSLRQEGKQKHLAMLESWLQRDGG